MFKFKHLKCLTVFIFVIIVFYIIQKNLSNESENWPILAVKKEYSFNAFKTCLNKAHDVSGSFETFIHQYRKCFDRFIDFSKLETFRMGRYGEDKVFLPLNSAFNQKDCKWITVGIGGDDQVEKLFKEKYPACNLFGVEASPDQYANFSEYGAVIPYGVGVESGEFDLTVRKGVSYKTQAIKVLAFSDLLDKYVKSKLIHYMTIDIEGFEYGILEEMLMGKKLDEQGIVFCQIDAELHSEKSKIRNILRKFDSDESQYLPISAKPVFLYDQHEKITWINIENEECRKAFDIYQFL